MSVKGPIGLYGGTFDPVHLGHLLLAEAARDELGLPQIQFVPAGDPPHKSSQAVTPLVHRLAMLRLAVADNPGFAVCTWECDQSGPSYTVHTLRHFQAQGYGPIYLLLGGDSVQALDTWYQPAEIRSLATIVALARPGWPVPAGVRTLALPQVDLASTTIRARVQAGRTVRYWVPEPVRAYLEQHGLYQSGAGYQAGNVLQ